MNFLHSFLGLYITSSYGCPLIQHCIDVFLFHFQLYFYSIRKDPRMNQYMFMFLFFVMQLYHVPLGSVKSMFHFTLLILGLTHSPCVKLIVHSLLCVCSQNNFRLKTPSTQLSHEVLPQESATFNVIFPNYFQAFLNQ